MFLSILFLCLFFLLNQSKLEANEPYNDLYLAYIRTEEPLLNKIALSGLNELSTHLKERTSLSPQGVKEIDLIKDDLFFYPLIYWQISNSSPQLNDITVKKIKNYFDSGGIILFDIVDFSKSYTSITDSSIEEIKNIFIRFGIKNLQNIPKNHTLTKSYYLLNNFPWSMG